MNVDRLHCDQTKMDRATSTDKMSSKSIDRLRNDSRVIGNTALDHTALRQHLDNYLCHYIHEA